MGVILSHVHTAKFRDPWRAYAGERWLGEVIGEVAGEVAGEVTGRMTGGVTAQP